MTFQKLIEEITARGWSQGEIAGECDVGQSAISSVARGETKDPRYSLGLAIVGLHQSGKTPPPRVRVRDKK